MTKDITIGITGGIGAGKSVVSRVLRCNGFNVYDCDYEAKKIMTMDSEVKMSLIEKLGSGIYNYDGTLNRGKLAEEIFSDYKTREFVNSVVHKAVIQNIEKKRKNIKGWFFIESAIIASSGISYICDKIWIITAPLDQRINRVINRDSISSEDIKKRMESQQQELSLLPNNEKLVIKNDEKMPLLQEILKLTDKYKNNQTFIISC